MIQLHYFPGNASMTPHMLLEEMALPYELVYVDRTHGAHKKPEYLKLNPNGQIPVLVDGSLVLYETAAICLHLCDMHPDKGLAPAFGTRERSHFYKWLVWLTNTPQAMLKHYFYGDRMVDADDESAKAQIKKHAEAQVDEMLDQIDAQLAKGGPWMLGERYSALDPYVLMLSRWTRGFARPARSLPHIGPFLQRMLERPAIKRSFEQEKLPQPWV